MKKLAALLLTAALSAVSVCADAQTLPTQPVGVTTPPTYQQAYDYSVNFLGIDPRVAVPVLLGLPVFTDQEQYLHDRLEQYGYVFPDLESGN